MKININFEIVKCMPFGDFDNYFDRLTNYVYNLGYDVLVSSQGEIIYVDFDLNTDNLYQDFYTIYFGVKDFDPTFKYKISCVSPYHTIEFKQIKNIKYIKQGSVVRNLSNGLRGRILGLMPNKQVYILWDNDNKSIVWQYGSDPIVLDEDILNE
jgi:hypothetical protein